MRKIVLGMLVLLSACAGDTKITEEEKVKIQQDLTEIFEIDQKYAGIPPAALRDKYGNEKAWELFLEKRDSVSRLHQEKIQNLFTKYGYLGAQKIGEEAASNFWLPIQHADNDVEFQQKMLEAMKIEIDKGSKDHYRYAMLEDRILVNLGKKQRFGTQLTYNDKGQAIPKNGLLDSTNIDSLRSAYSLPDMKEYYNGMTQMHFEMNKTLYQEKGILEPQLYP